MTISLQIIALLFSTLVVAATEFNLPLNFVAAHLDDAIDQAMIPLDHVFMLNGTRHSKSLRSHFLEFKATLMPRLKDDMENVLKEFDASRGADKSELTEDDKFFLSEKIQKSWTKSYNLEIRKWGSTRFQRWVLRAKDIWHGLEDKLERRMERIKKMFNRNDQ
jgi:hypothetical protein